MDAQRLRVPLFQGRAIETARELAATCGSEETAENFSGATNESAAAQCEVAFLTVPYSGMIATLHTISRQLRGKICVNTIAPLEVVDLVLGLIGIDPSGDDL